MLERADGVSDFKVIQEDGYRRVSVFGMGYTGYTLPKNDIHDVFGAVETKDDDDDSPDIDFDDLRTASYFVVWDGDLEKLAHYFYNLGREHGAKK